MSCLPPNSITFDFETYSELDVRKVGAWFYSIHPSTEVICMAYSINGGPEQIWHPGDPVPEWVNDPKYTMAAWNSFFEYCIWVNVLKWPFHGYDKWLDVAACAAAMALPIKLEKCCKVLGAPPESSKLKRGAYLIQRLSRPVLLKGTGGEIGRLRDEALELEMDEYCMMDVTATNWIADRIRPFRDDEYKLWQIDFAANARGTTIDIPTARKAVETRDKLFEQLDAEAQEISGGIVESMGSLPDATKAYIRQRAPMENFQKEYIAERVKDPDMPPDVKRLLEIRLTVGRIALSKYDVLVTLYDPATNKLHGLLQFHAATTGRWAGRLFQPQNLPRPEEDRPEMFIPFVHRLDIDGIDCFAQKGVAEVLSTLIRAMIVPAPGKRLLVADYNAIEARVLAWLAQENNILVVFTTHGKLYEAAASGMYGVVIEDVTTDQRLAGKIATLALGYQGGTGALNTMAYKMGVEFGKGQDERIVKLWRRSNPRIAAKPDRAKGTKGGYWWQVERAYMRAVKNPGRRYSCGPLQNVSFQSNKAWLACQLPSGRVLWFRKPRIGVNRFGSECVKIEGTDSKTKQWVVKEIYGGWMVESIVQAVARDIMAYGMHKLDAAGYELILTVHDEIISEREKRRGSLDEYIELMTTLPPWAEGLPIAADGFEGMRYGK